MGVLALIRATVAGIARNPIPYVIGAVGALLYWVGASLDILALGHQPNRSPELALGTMELTACLCAVLLASRLAGDDRSGHFLPIVAASSAGAAALWTSRVMGAALVGLLSALPTALLAVGLYMVNTTSSSHNMYSTFAMFAVPLTLEVVALAAWSALLGSAIGTWPGVASGLGLFVLVRVTFDSPWLGWLPAPASFSTDAVELARACLALLGPVALGAVVVRRDTSPV